MIGVELHADQDRPVRPKATPRCSVPGHFAGSQAESRSARHAVAAKVGAAAALDRVGKPLKPPARAQPDPLGQDSSKVEQTTELTGQEQQIPKPWQISGSLSHSENTANRAAGVRDG